MKPHKHQIKLKFDEFIAGFNKKDLHILDAIMCGWNLHRAGDKKEKVKEFIADNLHYYKITSEKDKTLIKAEPYRLVGWEIRNFFVK